MQEIILWERDAEIIRACEQAMGQAFKELGLKGIVPVNLRFLRKIIDILLSAPCENEQDTPGERG